MPGRVKHRHPTIRKATLPMAQRRLTARVADTSQGSSVFQLSNTADPKSEFNKQTIVWLVILSLIVVAALIIVTWLLCRCTCRRRRKAKKRHSNGHSHHPSLEVTDGRNEHLAWNRNALSTRADTDQGGDRLTLPSKAKMKAHGDVVHPGEPVIVETEEVPSTPMYARNKGSRYYSGFSHSRLSGAWKRISQVGRAY